MKVHSRFYFFQRRVFTDILPILGQSARRLERAIDELRRTQGWPRKARTTKIDVYTKIPIGLMCLSLVKITPQSRTADHVSYKSMYGNFEFCRAGLETHFGRVPRAFYIVPSPM
jgi:hypothetical protein